MDNSLLLLVNKYGTSFALKCRKPGSTKWEEMVL
jgi:hypothetical protein